MASSVKAGANKLENSADSIDNAIVGYTVDTHEDVVRTIRRSLAEARLAAAGLGALQKSSDLLARKTRAEGAEFRGPKTGRPLRCLDVALARDLGQFIDSKPVEIGSPALPPRPTLRTAVQAFVGAVAGLLAFQGIDWAVFGPGLFGLLPDPFIVAAWAQLLAHMSGGRTVADTLRKTFALGENAPWDDIEAAARRAVADRLLGELKALHVFANGRDYLVVPAEEAYEHHRHVAESFVDELASFRGRGRLDVLIGAKAVSRLPGETIVDVFEIGRGVWSKFRADVRRASGEMTNNDNVRPFRSAGAPH